jgi:hypothetical protein
LGAATMQLECVHTIHWPFFAKNVNYYTYNIQT